MKPPVFLTSTFVFRSAEEGRDFFDYVSGRKQPPAGQRRRPRLLALQPSQQRDRRGPARDLRGRGVLRAVRIGHVGDHHDDPGLRPPRRRHSAFPAALRRNGNPAVAHHGKFRHRRRRIRRRRERARHSGRRAGGARQGTGIDHPDRDAGQSDQYAGRYQAAAADRRRDRQRPRASGPSWSATTPCWARCSSIRWPTAPMSRSIR